MLELLAQQPNDGGGMVLAGGAIFVIWALFAIAGLALLIWALVDCIKNPNLSDTQRIIWAVVILCVGCIGPVLYLLVGRNTAPPPTGTGSGPTP